MLYKSVHTEVCEYMICKQYLHLYNQQERVLHYHSSYGYLKQHVQNNQAQKYRRC